MSGSALKLEGFEEFKPIFAQTPTGIYGMGIISDGNSAMNVLSDFEGSIAVITDHQDDYTKYGDRITIVDPDNVQGDEYDYTIVDIQNMPDLSTFDKLRYEYTILSRARNGVFIVDSLGEIKNSVVRADASTDVNTRDASGEIAGKEIKDYAD